MSNAQGFGLNGVVFHVTPDDSVALSGRAVVLHEVHDSAGAPIDSVYTNSHGRYRFLVSSPNADAEYFVSVEHDGIGYFSSVLRLAATGTDTIPPIVVYDTSHAGSLVYLRERHIVVREEEADGKRHIIELIVLRNDGRFTRIAKDTASPVWEGLLPASSSQFAVGESDVGAGAVYFRHDRVAVAAPIPPGEKRVLMSYFLPRAGNELDIPVDQATGRLTISIQDSTATAVGGGLILYGTEEVGGARLKRYEGFDVSGGTRVLVRFHSAFFSIERMQLFLVAFVAVSLAGTLTWWLRRQRAQVTA